MDMIKTTAGMDELAALIAAGDPIVISELAIGTGSWTADASATALNTELKRLPLAGDKTAAQTVHLTATDATDEQYVAYEVGIFLQSGTLLAIASDVQPLTSKATRTSALFAIDLPLPEADGVDVVIGGSNFALPQGTETVAGVLKITSQIIDDDSIAASAASVYQVNDAAAAAQSTADSAVSDAAAAQSTANSAVSAAGTAQSTANSAVSAAGTAQSTADSKINGIDKTLIWSGSQTSVDIDTITGGNPGNGLYLVRFKNIALSFAEGADDEYMVQMYFDATRRSYIGFSIYSPGNGFYHHTVTLEPNGELRVGVNQHVGSTMSIIGSCPILEIWRLS